MQYNLQESSNSISSLYPDTLNIPFRNYLSFLKQQPQPPINESFPKTFNSPINIYVAIVQNRQTLLSHARQLLNIVKHYNYLISQNFYGVNLRLLDQTLSEINEKIANEKTKNEYWLKENTQNTLKLINDFQSIESNNSKINLGDKINCIIIENNYLNQTFQWLLGRIAALFLEWSEEIKKHNELYAYTDYVIKLTVVNYLTLKTNNYE